jgi:hypothetical protein
MSRHFFYRLFPLFKSLIKKGSETNPFGFVYSTIAFTYGHGAFALATNKTEEINIIKKYKYTANGFTSFMIVDSNGRHFNVNNSFWYWKWDSIEDWTNINTNSKILVNYYGYRIPFLGMFPNVVGFSDNLNTKDFKLAERRNEREKHADMLKHSHF